MHIAPGYDPSESGHPLPAVVRESRERALEHIFGEDIEITYLSGVGRSPEELAAVVRDTAPDAVVLASALPGHRDAVMGLSDEALILHPVREEYRTIRGERDLRLIGFGVMREQGPQLLAGCALADRAGIAAELAIQRIRWRKKDERER